MSASLASIFVLNALTIVSDVFRNNDNHYFQVGGGSSSDGPDGITPAIVESTQRTEQQENLLALLLDNRTLDSSSTQTIQQSYTKVMETNNFRNTNEQALEKINERTTEATPEVATSEASTSISVQDDMKESTISVSKPVHLQQQENDLIRSLPGLELFDGASTTTLEDYLGFRQYAGYLTIDNTDINGNEKSKHKRKQTKTMKDKRSMDTNNKKNIFYWYVESKNDPTTDPVVFWTNGGPGCSGLVGFGTEHGPFFLTKNSSIDSTTLRQSTSTTTIRNVNNKYKNNYNGADSHSYDGDEEDTLLLQQNPYSWNTVANIIYVEQPCGVGFSYLDNDSKSRNHYATGDRQVAIDNYELIQRFFQRFPERQSNDFYIASESYGGHYIPQLTKEIWTRTSGNTGGKDDKTSINFKGMMVGNPYVDPYTNTMTQFEALYAHGVIDLPLYKKWLDNCQDPTKYLKLNCIRYMERMYNKCHIGIDPYALDYPICLENPSPFSVGNYMGVHLDDTRFDASSSRWDIAWSRQQLVFPSAQALRLRYMTMNVSTSSLSEDSSHRQRRRQLDLSQDNISSPPLLQPAKDTYRPCAEKHLETYLNRLDVRKAIHAKLDADPWTICSSKVKYDYQDYATSEVDLYKELVAVIAGKNGNQTLTSSSTSSGFHMLIFSGDNDSVCSLAGTQRWIWNLGVRAKKRNRWQPWKIDGQIAGFLTKFDIDKNNKSSLRFVTVHGAGHSVPSCKPREALVLFRNYLNGSW